jgi:hypothetical protein
VREAILQTFEEAGGVEYLRRVAKEDPKTFCPESSRACAISMTIEGSSSNQNAAHTRKSCMG